MDRRKPTVQMLGRYQPWHEGHTELFKRAHGRTGQVIIMVRDTGEGHHDRNDMIEKLAVAGFVHGRDFGILDVPNIVDITYGRDVGYTITQEHLDESIENISATDIRKKMEKWLWTPLEL